MLIVAGMDQPDDATPGEPTPESVHRPVLLHPLIDTLQPREGQVAVDGTLGGGGTTAALLERVGPTGRGGARRPPPRNPPGAPAAGPPGPWTCAWSRPRARSRPRTSSTRGRPSIWPP